MRSMLLRAVRFLLPLKLLLASACAGSGGHPPLADLQALTEPKPIPGDDIASDPHAEAHYNAAIESWGDRLHSAWQRLCRFYRRTVLPALRCAAT
jgi:hypothetical protein